MKDVSIIALMGRLVLSMGVVILLMWVAARVMRQRGIGGATPLPGDRSGGGRRRRGHAIRIEVLARQPLGRTASVAVVMAGGRALVLGVTETQVTLLAEADTEAMAREAAGGGSGGSGTGGGSDVVEGAMTAPLGQGSSLSGNPWKSVLEQLRERTVRR